MIIYKFRYKFSYISNIITKFLNGDKRLNQGVNETNQEVNNEVNFSTFVKKKQDTIYLYGSLIIGIIFWTYAIINIFNQVELWKTKNIVFFLIRD